MEFENYNPERKQRIVQELVPGKQITLAHIIASPDGELYEKLGLDPRVGHCPSRWQESCPYCRSA